MATIKKVILQDATAETVYAQAVAARAALESGPPEDGSGFRIYEVGASQFAVKFNRSSITVWPQPRSEWTPDDGGFS